MSELGSNHLIRLYSEQQDCFYEVVNFLDHSDRYYLLYFLSISSSRKDDEGVCEILNHFGMELMEQRMRIYANLNCIEGLLEKNTNSKSNWVIDSKVYKKLLKLYNSLNIEEFKHLNLEEKKNFITKKLELIGFSFKSTKTLFHIYRQVILFEIELFNKSLPKYNENTKPAYPEMMNSTDLEMPIDLKIGIFGSANSGKTNLLYSYCLNRYVDKAQKEIEQQRQLSAFVMIDGKVVNCEIQIITISNSERISQEIINRNFHVIAFSILCPFIESISNDRELFESEFMQPLRKLVMTFPLIPIHIIITGIDMIEASMNPIQQKLEKELENFPHITKISYVSSLTQMGLKYAFDDMYRSALSFKFQNLTMKNKCSLQ